MFNFETTNANGEKEVVIDEGLIQMMSDIIFKSLSEQSQGNTQINLASDSARKQMATRTAKDLVYRLVNMASAAGIAAVAPPPSAMSTAASRYKSNS